MRILHTSDWHLGRSLYGRRRYAEASGFLEWLIKVIEDENIDALLVSGDIFDTTTPSNKAMSLYYNFLHAVSKGSCRHIVITGGNHDSPTFLDASKSLLLALNVHVIGAPTEHIESEALLLQTASGEPELLVCAVPYLRDRDLRTVEAGESWEDKDKKILEGIARHYREVELAARQKMGESSIPLIIMGHLFTAGGAFVEGDGMRELYVGSLVHVPVSIFPLVSYIALGHLHSPQTVGGRETIRYSGAPIPMGFGEAGKEKSVVIVDFSSYTTGQVPPTNEPLVRLVPVPVFQRLEQIKGSLSVIKARLSALTALDESIWVEITYDDINIIANLRDELDSLIKESGVEILCIKDMRKPRELYSAPDTVETLDSLSQQDIFERCMEANEVPLEQRDALRHSYAEVVTLLEEEDHWDT